MSTLILGDPHLGKGVSIGKPGIGTSLNSRIADQLNILEWTLNQADKLNVNNIIITGDVFDDPKPHPAIIAMFISWLKSCEVLNIKVHIIAGNHDILRSGTFVTSALDVVSEAEINGIYVYKDITTIYSDDVCFTLIPFKDRRSFNTNSNTEALKSLQNIIDYEVAEIPITYKKVAIGHLALEGSIPVGDEIDDLSNELFCPLDMFSVYDYVWMGHVHKPQVMKKIPHISHIGSMDLSDFGETDHKKVLILFDPNIDNCFKEIKIPTRPLKKISIQVPEGTKDTTAFVIEQIKNDKKNLDKAIVKIDINLNSQDLLSVDRAVIEKFLYENKVFHISKFSESKKISPIKKIDESKEQIDNSMNESKAIKLFADTFIEEKIRDKFIKMANDIVNEYKVNTKD